MSRFPAWLVLLVWILFGSSAGGQGAYPAPAQKAADDVVLVRTGRPECVLLLSAKSAPPERNAAEVLQARIQKRTGCRVPLAQSKDGRAAVGAGQVGIVIGSPLGNVLAGELLRTGQRLVPTAGTVGPAGFVVHTLKADGRSWVVLAGSDPRGTVCAVGKFLRSLDFSGRNVTVGPLAVVDRVDARDVLEVQQQKPPQWNNSFLDSSLAQIRDYVEDLALWGSSSFVSLCAWGVNNPFKPHADATSRQKWARACELLARAHWLGMDVGYFDYPNCVYDDQRGLRELGGKFRYPNDVCPSVPEVRKVLLANRQALYRAAKAAGVQFSFLIHNPHDFGGCDCQRCAPWIHTYVKLSEDLYQLAVRHHPRVKVYFTTWMCSPAEKQLLLDYLLRQRPGWAAGIISRPALDLPAPYVSVGWQTIFGCGRWECYGKMGADPLPLFLPGKIQEFHRRRIRTIHTYSEGIYDDINSAIVAQVCRRPLRTDIEDILREYCHANFGANRADSATLASLILARFKHAQEGPFNASLRVEEPGTVLATLAEMEPRLPAWGKDDWRYGIFKTRVQLEVLDQRAAGVKGWLQRVDAVLAQASAPGDDAALRKALERAKRFLGDLEVAFSDMEQQSQRLARRLYVDLYGSPNRHAAHGSFQPELEHRILLPALAQRCDVLLHERSPTERRAAVNTLLWTLRAQGKYASVPARPALVLHPKGTLVMPGSCFAGGAGWSSPDQLLRTGVNVLEGSATGRNTITAEFDFQPGEEPLKTPVKLTLRGTDRSAGNVLIEIAVNGHTVFSGKSGLSGSGPFRCTCQIRPEEIVAGKNRLVVRNRAAGGAEAAVLVESATLEVSPP
jgi:hypothetical protein